MIQGFDLKCFSSFKSIKPIMRIYKATMTEEQRQKFRTGEITLKNIPANLEWIQVYQSIKMGNPNPKFQGITISSQKLCGGHLNYPIKV